MAAMMGHQGAPTSLGELNNMKSMTPAGQQVSQMHANSGTNIHVASLVGNQGVNFQVNTSSGVPAQPSAVAPPVAPQVPAISVVPITSSETEEPCLVCGKKGDIFTCNGGCGLHVHPACIGVDAIFPFVGTSSR